MQQQTIVQKIADKERFALYVVYTIDQGNIICKAQIKASSLVYAVRIESMIKRQQKHSWACKYRVLSC